MQLFKSRFLRLLVPVTLIVLNLHVSNAKISDMDCLNSNFSTKVSHNAFPFGLNEKILKVNKDGCVITINHTKMKFIDKVWTIDVCRGPVHVKYGSSSIEVFKRAVKCTKGNRSKFCKNVLKINNILQDDGLIFAEGEKEDINTSHGMVYCSYKLLSKYLIDGLVFGKDSQYDNIIFKDEKNKITAAHGKVKINLTDTDNTGQVESSYKKSTSNKKESF